TTAGLLTLSGGILAKGTNALTANAGLTMSGGALTSTSGAVRIAGNVSIAAASYIVFGSETWTVSGSWTDNSTSASWSIGTATVAFNASSAQPMTFAALPGNAPEFYNVTFNSGASTVTFTMTTKPLTGSVQTVSILNTSNGFYNLAVSGTVTQSTAIDVTNSLTVSGTLTTGGFNITGGSNLFVPDGGTLAAGTSTSTFTNVTMTGAV